MTSMRSNKNGFILIMVIIFMIITLISTWAFYILVSSNYSVLGINTPAQIKGYYAALGGLRYAAIVMLNDPTVITTLGTTNPSTWDLKIYTPSSGKVYSPSSIYQDLGLQSPHDINITIQDMKNGTYTLTASYN